MQAPFQPNDQFSVSGFLCPVFHSLHPPSKRRTRSHMTARVSVIIRTCNRAAYLREAIESVWAQTFRDLDLIVVDDGSTDATRDVLTGYDGALVPIFLPQRNNAAVTFNAGVRAASGELVAFLDDDDVWLPEKLARQVELLERNPRFGFAYGNVRLLYEDGHLSPPVLAPHEIVVGSALRAIVRNMCIAMSALIVRRPWLDRAGLLDEAVPAAETLFCFRLAQSTDAVCVPEPVCLIRRHEKQVSRDHALSSYETTIAGLETLLRDRSLPRGVRLEAHRSIARYHAHLARNLTEANRPGAARRHAVQALWRYPFHRPAWRWALRSLFG